MTDDIKIYSDKQETTGNSMSEIFNMVEYHKSNGNFEKAKRLGDVLSTLSPTAPDNGLTIDCADHHDGQITQGILFQLKVLLTFAAETIVKREITPSFLSITVINAMHDKISAKHPNIFKNMSDGAAFTMYNLALDYDGEDADNIGEAFAMLCAEDGEHDELVNLGKSMWELGCKTTSLEIKKLNFKK